MEKNNSGKVKGVIELNWKIFVAIIAAVISFVVIFLVMTSILKGENLAKTGSEMCLLIFNQLKKLGLGDATVKLCDVFTKA